MPLMAATRRQQLNASVVVALIIAISLGIAAWRETHKHIVRVSVQIPSAH